MALWLDTIGAGLTPATSMESWQSTNRSRHGYSDHEASHSLPGRDPRNSVDQCPEKNWRASHLEGDFWVKSEVKTGVLWWQKFKTIAVQRQTCSLSSPMWLLCIVCPMFCSGCNPLHIIIRPGQAHNRFQKVPLAKTELACWRNTPSLLGRKATVLQSSTVQPLNRTADLCKRIWPSLTLRSSMGSKLQLWSTSSRNIESSLKEIMSLKGTPYLRQGRPHFCPLCRTTNLRSLSKAHYLDIFG